MSPSQGRIILVDRIRGMTDAQCPMTKKDSPILCTSFQLPLVIDHWPSAIKE